MQMEDRKAKSLNLRKEFFEEVRQMMPLAIKFDESNKTNEGFRKKCKKQQSKILKLRKEIFSLDTQNTNKLYAYRKSATNYEIEGLRNETICLVSPINFNDPYDSYTSPIFLEEEFEKNINYYAKTEIIIDNIESGLSLLKYLQFSQSKAKEKIIKMSDEEREEFVRTSL